MPTKDEVAHHLAQSHFTVDTGITRIYRLARDGQPESDPAEPIKLLEVNEETLPLGVRPVYFRAHPASGVVFPSAIIEITPEEFEGLTRPDGNVRLPKGWTLGDEIPRAKTPQETAS